MLFFAWHRKHKKIIYSRSKIRNKNPGHVFLDFILLYCSLISQWKKSVENNLVMLELLKEMFLSTEYPDSGSKFQKFGKLISNYFHVV